MSEFEIQRSSDDLWDLQAIVKGCNSSEKNQSLSHQEYYKDKEDEANEHLKILNSGEINNQKPRRRQRKQKMNIVHQVAGDRVLSDKWNWRKYGQKTIKGSPYPRSYYKCSKSGGCMARKQVEHSSTNPATFLISYFGEHNHPYPTRHHSQAGRAKHRFDTSSKALATAGLSATASTHRIDHESLEDAGRDVVLEDDIFGGLEYLEGLEMYVLFDGLSFDQFPSSILL